MKWRSCSGFAIQKLQARAACAAGFPKTTETKINFQQREGEPVSSTTNPGRINSTLRKFLDNEASGGLVLMAVALLALITANSPFAEKDRKSVV